MKIKTVLVSQPQPTSKNSPYIELAKKLKLKLDFRPFIHVEEVSSSAFAKTKINIVEHSAVIFTSRTSIDHFLRVVNDLDLEIPTLMKFFCISESTAFYLQQFIGQRKKSIYVGKKKFEDLIPLLKKHHHEKFLIPLSDKHKAEIPNLLKENKINYTPAILYKTVISDLSDLADVYYDVLVFYSPSGIQSLFKNFPDFIQNNTVIATFGPSTAKAARDRGLRVDIEAPSPQAPSMTLALETFIKKRNKAKKAFFARN